MEFERNVQDRDQIETILWSDDDPISKVQQLIKLGMPEETAVDIVERYQIGQPAAVYYEQLPHYRREDL